MCVPSLLYVMQNSLQFVAINHLDASAFTILSQLKILTTAVCSVLMLGTHLSLRKWRALVLLVIGAVLVQFPAPSAGAAASESRTSFTGLAAVLGMVCLSGIAGIWLEKFLKNRDTATLPSPIHSAPPAATLWERNLQLSLYGILFGLSSVLINDMQAVRSLGFFHSYSAWTLLVILIAAVGGLIVAVVVKYTNTIVKGFAASCSIILTSMCSLALFPSDALGWLFWLGASCVLLSIFSPHSRTHHSWLLHSWALAGVWPLCLPHGSRLAAVLCLDFNEEDNKSSGVDGRGSVSGAKGDGEASSGEYKKVMEQPLMGGSDADDADDLTDSMQLLRK